MVEKLKIEPNKFSAKKEIMRISWGPQHPMSGQFRLLIDTDGENVFGLIPDIGFTHRGIEKILENRLYFQGVVPVERMVMADCANVGLGYVLAVEELLGVEAPRRAQFIRSILCEVSRINSHLYAYGLMAEGGGGYPAVFLWTVADREFWLELAEMLTGARWSYSFFVPGGVRNDLPKGFKEKALRVCDYFEKRLDVYRDVWTVNEVFVMRCKGVGVLSGDDAVRLGACGPSLRGSGVAFDVRRDEPYAAYGDVDFKVCTMPEGDSYARFVVRWLEMKESVRIIRQCVEEIPDGPIRVRVPNRVPKGEACGRVETGRGEMVFHVVSEGGLRPYRVKIISPTLRNLYVFSQLPKLGKVLFADVPIILYSFDPWYLDSDR